MHGITPYRLVNAFLELFRLFVSPAINWSPARDPPSSLMQLRFLQRRTTFGCAFYQPSVRRLITSSYLEPRHSQEYDKARRMRICPLLYRR
jgi:hypothetical protein